MVSIQERFQIKSRVGYSGARTVYMISHAKDPNSGG